MGKRRLDDLMVDQGIADSRDAARRQIMAGNILVDSQKITTGGTLVDSKSTLRVLEKKGPYVSRGGEKLEGAWKMFKFQIQGRNALDIGQSTGGFTDFLLKKGAVHVVGVDVGYGLLDIRLRNDNRVSLMERTNARNLTRDQVDTALLEDLNLAVIDVSFISILKIVPALSKILGPEADIISLIKPQFEAEKGTVARGGVISDPKQHTHILSAVKTKLNDAGYVIKKECVSPILGAKGNKEFFFWLKRKES